MNFPLKKNNYYFFSKGNSFIVVNLIKHDYKKRVNIIYTSCLDLDSEIYLSRQIVNWSIENNLDIIWLNSDDLKRKKEISKLFSYKRKINFVCNSNEKFIKTRELTKIFNIHAVDTDSEILYVR